MNREALSSKLSNAELPYLVSMCENIQCITHLSVSRTHHCQFYLNEKKKIKEKQSTLALAQITNMKLRFCYIVQMLTYPTTCPPSFPYTYYIIHSNMQIFSKKKTKTRLSHHLKPRSHA